jgi:ubiquinone/menaquinone biosynthesis C-methylase UbiE
MNSPLYQDMYELEDQHWWHISKRELCKKIIQKYFKGGKIVDIGCGTGKNVEAFSEFGPVTGIDSSEEALKFCKKRGLPNVSKGDAEKTNLPANSFALVTLLDVLEHTDDTKTLKEIHRILKKDGLLLITVPAYQWMWSQWDVELHHKRRYTKSGLEKLLKKYGYDIVLSSYRQSFMVLPVYAFRKLKTIFKPLDYGSDFKVGSPFVSVPLLYVTNLEHALITSTSIPFGMSIVVLAKKT